MCTSTCLHTHTYTHIYDTYMTYAHNTYYMHTYITDNIYHTPLHADTHIQLQYTQFNKSTIYIRHMMYIQYIVYIMCGKPAVHLA